MNSRFLKIWYGIAGFFTGLAIIYYIVRLFDYFFGSKPIEGTLLEKLNIYAIISFAIALLMLLALLPFSKFAEKKVVKAEEKKSNDNELLAKYKSKK